MTRRVRALWLPALTVTLVAEVTLYLVMRSGYRPWTTPLDWHVFHSHHPLLLASFVLAPGAALALGLFAATVWERHARRAGARAVEPEADRA
jgi:Na+-translocating ferredoxin:NAD+ oxidoreductase RnfE subunit